MLNPCSCVTLAFLTPLIGIDYNASARQDDLKKKKKKNYFHAHKIDSALTTSEAQSRMQREFNAYSRGTHTLRTRPHYLRACRRKCLWRFSPGDEADETTVSGVCDGVYTIREQLYLRAYQRPLFMSPPIIIDSSPQRSIPRLFLALFATAYSPGVLSGGSVLLRSAYMADLKKER